ncbi:MAG: extracellular solute-binding protein [Planctomycetes bacterium]|nr:extracellular solute-binding protein [Planctomycetota bacterium]
MSKKWSRRDFLKTSALLSAGAVLAACGPVATPQPPAGATEAPKANPPAVGKKKIVFSAYTWSNFEAKMTAILDGWAKDANVEYEGQYVPQTIDYWAKIQTQVASGTPPDVGMSDYGRLVSYAKNGTLLDITNYVMSSKFPLDTMFPGATAQYRWAKGDFDSGGKGGNYYGLPSDAQSMIFAYNKKMFDDAGVTYPTDDWTWDDMLSAAKKITKADANKWGMQVIDQSILFKGNFVWAAGGALHTPDFSKSMLADPKTIEAYKWDWDLIYTHKVAPPPGMAGQQNPFMSGQVAMIVDGVWWVPDFGNGIKDFDWDIAMLPKHPQTGKRTVSLESDGWWVYKGAKDPDTAWNLVSYLAGANGQKLMSNAGFCIPANIQEVAQAWYSQKPPENRLKILDNINKDSAKVDFTYFEFGTITNAVWPIIVKAFADGTDITAAMQEADKVMNEELTKAWALLKS